MNSLVSSSCTSSSKEDNIYARVRLECKDNVKRLLLEAVYHIRASLTGLLVLDPSDFDELTTVTALFDAVTT